MKKLWTTRDIDAPADALWDLLTDVEMWPRWGPSIKDATLRDGVFELGASGTVSTVVGVKVPFEINEFDEGSVWGWTVAGLPATSHTVDSRGAGRCRVGFGVPWTAAPYLIVCDVALRRLEGLADCKVAQP